MEHFVGPTFKDIYDCEPAIRMAMRVGIVAP